MKDYIQYTNIRAQNQQILSNLRKWNNILKFIGHMPKTYTTNYLDYNLVKVHKQF